ncbi:unnamed protein product, partial [Effrenium voratum]
MSARLHFEADLPPETECLTDWLQCSRVLRQFLLRFSDPLWVDIAKNLCTLGVLSLQQLSPETTWSASDLSELVVHLQREGWPKGKSGPHWTPPWRRTREVFTKPSPRWRAGSSEPLRRVMVDARDSDQGVQLIESPRRVESPRRARDEEPPQHKPSAEEGRQRPEESPQRDSAKDSLRRSCALCDHPLVPDAHFCPNCGAQRKVREPPPERGLFGRRLGCSQQGWSFRGSRLERGGWAAEVDLGRPKRPEEPPQLPLSEAEVPLRAGLFGAFGTSTALAWLDLRLPFAELIRPVLKASQAHAQTQLLLYE